MHFEKEKGTLSPTIQGRNKDVTGCIAEGESCQMKTLASQDLIQAVISLRSIKERVEIEEIEKAVDYCI